MKTVPTTLRLPTDLHESLREKAFQYKQSLNSVIVSTLREAPERKYSSRSIEKETEDDIQFFKKMAKIGPQIDPVKAVRAERDRDETSDRR